MGKASKWILNFLIGKQEKKNEALLNEQCLSSTTKPSHLGTPKVKRRWSFGRSSHRVLKSVDSIDTTKLPMKPQQNHVVFVSREVENAAATRIQAVFRGHLVQICIQNFYDSHNLNLLLSFSLFAYFVFRQGRLYMP